MTQYMRPASDINSSFVCSTGSARYALIDEVVADDADYIYEQYTNEYQECKFNTPAQTPNAGTATLRFRAKKANSNTGKITPSVRLGSSAIKTGSAVDLTTSYNEYILELNSIEAGNITDWSDVRVRFLSTLSSNTVYVSWAVLEVQSPPDLCIGCAY